MADGYIALGLGSFSATMTEFNTESDFPRISGEFPTLEFSDARNLIAPGAFYRNPERWSFEAILPRLDALNLKGLYAEHRRLVDARQNPNILLIDTTSEFCELGGPTRARADAPFDGVSSSGGYSYYFARFLVFFEAPLELRYWGATVSGEPYWVATCRLVEVGEVVAP